jgi:hypothetical protein
MVDVPNASFEEPRAPRVPPFARPAFSGFDDDDWLQTPLPPWWTFGQLAWNQSAGVFFNVPDPELHITNADGEQVVFMFATPDLGIFQDLAATYEVGRSYSLTVALRGGSGGMPLGSPIELSLYYRDDDGYIVPIAATEFLNDYTGSPTLLLDASVELTTVQPADAWADRPIGIMILATVGLDEPQLQGGTWGIDNVRLEARGGLVNPGDLDGDSDVDLVDYLSLSLCLTGPAEAISCGNDRADMDGDGGVDLKDVALFVGRFTGSPL